MSERLHVPTGAVDPCCPPVLPLDAEHYLGAALEDAQECSRRLRWLAGEWPLETQAGHLRRLAALSDVVAAEVRAILREVG